MSGEGHSASAGLQGEVRREARLSITRWWWVRHAPALCRPGEILGQREAPADCAASAAEIAALAALLPRGAVWFASPLQRTAATAAALARASGARPELHFDPDLCEQRFGLWEGLTHDEVSARYPGEAARFWSDPAGAAPPGGESFAALAQRVGAAIGRVHGWADGSDIVAVAHAGTIRTALMLALGLDGAAALRFAIDPLSLTRLDSLRGPRSAAEGGAEQGWSVLAVNQKAALRQS